MATSEPTGVVRRRVTAPHSDVQMTKQAGADTQSVSQLLSRYVNAGMVPANGPMPSYGDFTGIGDAHEAMNRVMQMQDDFMALPAPVRKVAENDPAVFLEMVYGGRPEMMKQLEAAGLVKVQWPAALQKPAEEPALKEPAKAPEKP